MDYMISMILIKTTVANAMTSGRMPTLANLAIREDTGELLDVASSRVARNIIRVAIAATLTNALIPKAVIVVMVVTVGTIAFS